MADEPKTNTPAPASPPDGQTTPPAAAPTPDAPPTADPAADSSAEAKAVAASVQKDPLSDGTIPTVLTPGDSHKKVPRGKASITSIYRRADIMTTLFTFVGALVAAAIVVGIYAYFTRAHSSTTPTPTKVATLDKSELEKLGAFFDGNSAGAGGEILTITSSTLFKNRVAVGSDLKVTGGLQVTATAALADLTVDKTSTLGITNIRGALTVTGPLTAQSPAILGAGATITGNLNATGNGTFGGSLSATSLNVHDISVAGTLNLAGHLSISGQNPSAAPITGVSTSASVDGNDAAGTVTVTVAPHTGSTPSAQLVTVTFRSAYPRVPHIVITPIGPGSAQFQPFILKTATGFTIGAADFATPNNNPTSYSFDYWVVQ
ncbi:MAG TPA: hypothetical protein VMT30_00250 [Candidatus Saccharimonadia bacterium]|nr:hypothetical protein [Candidatus Saccharimonadia bacterium]